MLRLLILCLVLSTTATSEIGENESSGDDAEIDDDSDDQKILNEGAIVVQTAPRSHAELPVERADKAPAKDTDGFTTTVIIAAVCVVALAAVAIAAVILVRRHMHNRQQGVYSVPVEQSEKPAI